ncbi:MAG: ATP-binding protein [Acidobacteriota bacterium]
MRKKIEENLREEKIRAEKLFSQLEFAHQTLREIQSQMIKEETMVTTGELATGIAHEIRNPLGIIHASAQFCLDTFFLPKDLRKHLKTILRNAENANKVIRDLLEFAKPADIELKPGEISKILDKTCALLRAKCLQQRIRVVKKISKYLPKIMLDEKHLEGAFLNFMLNSTESMPDGGTLKISGDLKKDKKSVIITISDTGCGIDPKNIKYIFTPFYTTKRGGVGLGLSIARRIIDIHKGKIRFKSKVGSGTKAIIKFPVINN